MRCARTMKVWCGALVVLAGMLLCLGQSAGSAPNQGMPAGAAMLRQKEPGAIRLLDMDYRMVDLSLNVREQVDFLLTPALLVQEAVSDDVVLTYPEE
jgi:hypothetical protein